MGKKNDRKEALKAKKKELEKELRKVEQEIDAIKENEQEELASHVIEEHHNYVMRAFEEKKPAESVCSTLTSNNDAKKILVLETSDKPLPVVKCLFVDSAKGGIIATKLFDSNPLMREPRMLFKQTEVQKDLELQLKIDKSKYTEIQLEEFWECYRSFVVKQCKIFKALENEDMESLMNMIDAVDIDWDLPVRRQF